MKRLTKEAKKAKLKEIDKAFELLDLYDKLENPNAKWKLMKENDKFLMSLLQVRMKNQYFTIETSFDKVVTEEVINYLDNRSMRIRDDLNKILYN